MTTGEKYKILILITNCISRVRHLAQFWQQVSPGITLELAEAWAYGVDMEVFGYNIDKYFEEIGLPGYLDG